MFGMITNILDSVVSLYAMKILPVRVELRHTHMEEVQVFINL